MGETIGFAYRSVNGIFLKRGINPPTEVLSRPLDVRNNLVRAMEFSNRGKFLAYCDSEKTICIDTETGEETFSHPFAKTAKIVFSPDDKFMVTYEPYVIYGSRIDEDGNTKKPNPNLRFYDSSNGTLLATLIQKNQSAWQPMFTDDGQTFVMIENSELHFFDTKDPERYTRKGVIKGIETLKISPGQDPLLAVFVPSKNEANIISLRNFHGDLRSICQKSTFNADKCEFHWNAKGSACLAVTSVEVDQSNKSYYGVNNVFLLSKMGDSIPVSLSKQGPVHSIQWSPTGSQFCVCFGYMPSKVVVFNLKASVVWDMGESHRNEIYYNTFGTILATCGFGNIASGKIQMWDVEKREEIVTMEVPNTTYFEWAPDGQNFLTATTSPRLRIDNNYRIWNYIGNDVYEEQMTERVNTKNGEETKQIELAQVAFKPAPGVYQKFKICKLTPEEKRKLLEKRLPTEGEHPINSMRKAGVVSANSVYVPPALRPKGGDASTPAVNNKDGAVPTTQNTKSATAQNTRGSGNKTANKDANNQSSNKSAKNNVPVKAPVKEVNETEKKIKTLMKKVKECEELKQRKEKGEVLESNQLAKIDKLHEMKSELEKLSLSA